MLKIGIRKIRKDTDIKAKLIYDFLDKNPHLTPFVKNKMDRSQTVIVAQMDQKTESLITFLKEQGLIVGSGYGKLKDFQVRIANVPANSIQDTKLLIKYLRLYTKQLKLKKH